MSLNTLSKLAAATLLVAVSACSTSLATPAGPVHEGASKSVPAENIGFFGAGVKTEAGELNAGPAYGDLQAGRHGTFIRMPAGFVSPLHSHTEDYFAVVIEGVGANDPVGAEPTRLPVGSYWFQRGEEDHVTRCLSETDCLFFIVQPGKFDYVPAG